MANQELHVIFGTGPVGQAVARELVERGKTAAAASGRAACPRV